MNWYRTLHELISPAFSISGNSICSLQVKRATAMAFKLYVLSGHLHEFSLQIASSKHTCMLDGCFRRSSPQWWWKNVEPSESECWIKSFWMLNEFWLNVWICSAGFQPVESTDSIYRELIGPLRGLKLIWLKISWKTHRMCPLSSPLHPKSISSRLPK